MEARRGLAARRADRTERAGGAKGRALELALLRRRGEGLVRQLPLLHPLYQDHLLQGRGARPAAPGRIEGPRHALSPHPRGRGCRREAARELAEAGGGDPRLDHRTIGRANMAKDEESASHLIDEKIAKLGGWRGDTLAHLRALIREAEPGVTETIKWRSEEHPSELQSLMRIS